MGTGECETDLHAHLFLMRSTSSLSILFSTFVLEMIANIFFLKKEVLQLRNIENMSNKQKPGKSKQLKLQGKYKKGNHKKRK